MHTGLEQPSLVSLGEGDYIYRSIQQLLYCALHRFTEHSGLSITEDLRQRPFQFLRSGAQKFYRQPDAYLMSEMLRTDPSEWRDHTDSGEAIRPGEENAPLYSVIHIL